MKRFFTSAMFTPGVRLFAGLATMGLIGMVVTGFSTCFPADWSWTPPQLHCQGEQGIIDSVLGPLTVGWKGGVGNHFVYGVFLSVFLVSVAMAGVLAAFMAIGFTTLLAGIRLGYFFSPRIYFQSLVQYSDQSDNWSANLRFGWLSTAGTGLFVVYNQTYGVDSLSGPLNRSLIIKYSRQFTGGLPTIGQQWQTRSTRGLTLSYTHNFRSNLLNEFRYGFGYNNNPRNPPTMGKQVAQELGIVGLVDDLPDINGLFKVAFTGLGITPVAVDNDYRHPGFENWVQQFQEQLSWYRGKHNIKMGALLIRRMIRRRLVRPTAD